MNNSKKRTRVTNQLNLLEKLEAKLVSKIEKMDKKRDGLKYKKDRTDKEWGKCGELLIIIEAIEDELIECRKDISNCKDEMNHINQ